MNMIAIILAGGLGTRISNETTKKPKPLILINNKPIISYIISHYRKHHINKFIIAGGYKFEKLSQYFHSMKKDDNMFFDNGTTNKIEPQKHNKFLNSPKKNKFFVKVINTGLKTQTGGRIMKLKSLLKEQDHFFLTYGDGISNVNINKTYKQFKKQNYIAQVTAVRSPPRFGEIKFSERNKSVKKFSEKPSKDASWINGGFFILRNKALDFLKKDENFEKDILPRIVKKKGLSFYKHSGYWQGMDTPRDKEKLEKDIKSGKIRF